MILVLSAGCATTAEHCPTVPDIETIDRWRFVPIPDALTAPVEIPDITATADILELGAAYKAARVRLHQANGHLEEIARIEGTEKKD